MDRIPEFVANHSLLAIAAGVIIVLLIANELRRLFRPYKELTPSEAVGLLNKGALAIDTRSADAYRKAHLPEARHIPLDEIADNYGSLLKDNKPLIVYCDAGFSSAKAAAGLAKETKHNGKETPVYSLKGGLATWQRENFPTVK